MLPGGQGGHLLILLAGDRDAADKRRPQNTAQRFCSHAWLLALLSRQKARAGHLKPRERSFQGMTKGALDCNLTPAFSRPRLGWWPSCLSLASGSRRRYRTPGVADVWGRASHFLPGRSGIVNRELRTVAGAAESRIPVWGIQPRVRQRGWPVKRGRVALGWLTSLYRREGRHRHQRKHASG